MRRAAALVGASLGLGCFQSDFLAGLPCDGNGDCGELKCEDGFCGGKPADSATESSTTSEPETSSTTTDATIDPDTSVTIDPDTSASESESGATCPPDCPCVVPPHEPCDAGVNSIVIALGLSCPDEAQVATDQSGSVAGRTTRDVVGGFSAREGERFAVLGSGLVGELESETPEFDLPEAPTFCNDDQGNFDPGTLPAPMTAEAAPASCDDPDIVGMQLDCSGTLAEQIVGEIEDYSSFTVGAEVPEGVRSFSFDFAFSSVEYPAFVGGAFNDLFVAWLQSEAWTGNVSFAGGDAISVNSSLLVLTDPNFTEPMFAGTCMRGHASTGWLTTTAPVIAGEEILLVFAVFDQVDSASDSFVFLDAFQWNCSGVPAPETHS